jgi:hypothetical protein
MIAIAGWLRWAVAVGLFALIGAGGLMFLRGIVRSRPKEKIEVEEVSDLDVFFVCNECGTEFQVTKLGEIQVPRHCGEPMSVLRRPRHEPLGN